MSEKWRVRVDQDVCIGSGMCAASAPDYFVLLQEGVSTPKTELVDPDDEAVKEAVEYCPVEAISVEKLTESAS